MVSYAAQRKNKVSAIASQEGSFLSQQDKVEIQILKGNDWLASLIQVHADVRAEMPEAKRHCLLPKSETYFADLLSGKTGAIFGAIVNGQLAGFMTVLETSGFAEAKAKGIITCPDTTGRVEAAFGKGRAAVAQSLCVLKAFGGNGYSHALIKACIDWANKNGYPHLFAQVAQENAPSWMRFMSYGFALVEGWMNGHSRFLLRWMSPSEIKLLQGQATKSDLHSVNKDYAELPALLVLIGAMLRKGRIVLAQGAEPSSTKLNVMFGSIG